MIEIQAAIASLQSGDQDGGRQLLESIWTRIQDKPAPMHECVLAHYMADVQADPLKELAWDKRSLNAAMRCLEAEADGEPGHLIRDYLPSLNLNLGDVYLRLDDLSAAQRHLAEAQRVVAAAPYTPYIQMIRRDLDRVADRIFSQATARSQRAR